MGDRILSLRGDGPWRGKSTRAVVDRGERRMIRLVNGYVSGDGTEIRQMPGWVTMVDLSLENNKAHGYYRVVNDLMLPVYRSPVGESGYRRPDDGSDFRDLLTFKARAKPTHLHGFLQMGSELVIWGESDHRRHPVYQPTPGGTFAASSPGQRIVLNSPTVVTKSGNFWQVTLTRNVTAPTNRDWYPSGTPAPGWHAALIGDVVWFEDITVADSTAQAEIDATLNGRFHTVTGVSTSNITLGSQPNTPGNVSSHAVTAGDVYLTRSNRSSSYPTPGLSPYAANFYDRIDDPDALTAWYVPTRPNRALTAARAHPSWVANRMRDFSDSRQSLVAEGVNVSGNSSIRRGISRRRQKTLPYRTNPCKAGNRLILAAPGYGCLFQVPRIIPNVGAGWPVTPDGSGWTSPSGSGVLYPYNDVMDKPRCLGLPKAMMIESLHTTPPDTPDTRPNNFNIGYQADLVTTPRSWNEDGENTWRVAISYQDDATGEEGLASEPVTVVMASPWGAVAEHVGYTIQILYIHPGYIMPECLALKLNVYIGKGATGPLGYYMSLPLARTDKAGASSRLYLGYPLDYDDVVTPAGFNAKYGFGAGTPYGSPSTAEMWRAVQIPFPQNTSPITGKIDYTRLAPTATNMPRGAECAQVIRGVMLSVGHSGTHGTAGQLRRSALTAVFNPRGSTLFWPNPDELVLRGVRSPKEFTATPNSVNAEDGPFGLASNYFPSAYQGTEIWAYDLYPEPRKLDTVDKVLNFKSHNNWSPAGTGTGAGTAANVQLSLNPDVTMAQRLRMIENPWDSDIASPSGTPIVVSRGHVECYHVLPKGQIQVSEPGRPDVTLATEIQFLDPTEDDDGVAVGHFQGMAVICSKRETFVLNWRVAPTGETPRLVHRKYGCIATNSMVEFDGGLAWISERGPVAMTGDGLQFVGSDLEEDFYGSQRRYLKDSKGMMRHCWGAHDKSRGLVLWGLVTSDSTHTVSHQGVSATFSSHSDAARSRFPCNEILVWSYRANAFSVWQMPSGLEVLWVDELVDSNGDTRLCFLAADGRIYAWDDAYQDTNTRTLTHVVTSSSSGTTMNPNSFTFGTDDLAGDTSRSSSGLGADTFLRAGMTVVQTDANGQYKNHTTLSAVSASTQIVTFAKTLTWEKNDIFSFGHRPQMEIQTTYVGEALFNMQVDGVHLRYWLPYEGQTLRYSWVRCDVLKTDGTDLSGSPQDVGATQDPEYQLIGAPKVGDRTGRRLALTQGRAVGPEVSLSLKFLTQSQVRLGDVLLEIA